MAESMPNEKRERTLSRKALENAIDVKRQEVDNNARLLRELYNAKRTERELNSSSLHEIRTASLCCRQSLDELAALYEQDKWGDYAEEARVTKEFSILERARALPKRHDCPEDALSQSSRGPGAHISIPRFGVVKYTETKIVSRSGLSQETGRVRQNDS